MATLISFYISMAIVLGLVSYSSGGTCFNFPGRAYLRFSPLNFINDDAAHFSMKFSTEAPNGLLLYSKGPHHDYEALIVRDGKLEYLLFNPEFTGIGGTSGGHFRGHRPVNTGEEITVHVYRNFNVAGTAPRTTRKKTGLQYFIGSQMSEHVDYIERVGVALNPDVYIGGFENSISNTVHNFTGKIWDIEESKNRAELNTFSYNHFGRVRSNCVDFNPN